MAYVQLAQTICSVILAGYSVAKNWGKAHAVLLLVAGVLGVVLGVKGVVA